MKYFKIFSFLLLLLTSFSFSQEAFADCTPTNVAYIERPKAGCEALGGECTSCTGGKYQIGICDAIIPINNYCMVTEEQYKKLVDEGKLPGKSDDDKANTTEECNAMAGLCKDSCIGIGEEKGKCDDKPFCCKPVPNTGTPSTPVNASFDYQPLEPIPGIDPSESSDFEGFIESIYVFALWSVGIASLFMLTIGGFWYMTSAGNTSRVGEAKKIIASALVGLLIALITWLILYVLNPDLVRINIDLESFSTDISGSIGSYNKGVLDTPVTVGCGKIVEAAHQMVDSGCTYSQPRRNACAGSPAYTDCSDFTYHAYKRAGCDTGFGNTTLAMHRKVPSWDGSPLKAGDALVYRYDNNTKGHVVVCEQDGCNTVTHASGKKSGLKKGASANSFKNKPGVGVIRAELYCKDALNSC